MGEGPTPSFADATPKSVTDFCRSTLSFGQSLVERESPERITLIRGVTVIPMTGPSRLPDHDVALRGDKIISVSPRGAHAFPNARIVEGAGKFLAPGLADMHAHPGILQWMETMVERFPGLSHPERFTLPSGLLMLQNLVAGVTRIDVMAGDPDALLLRDEIKAKRMAGPNMRVSSPLIDGPTPIHSAKMSWRCADADGGRKAAEMILEMGFDFAKPYNNLPADAYGALMQACQAQGIPVIGHIPLSIGVEAAIAAGQQDIAHVGELFHWLEDPLRSDEARLEKLADELARSGRFVQLTTAVSGRVELVLFKDRSKEDFPDTAFCNPLINKVYDPANPALQAIKALPHVKALANDAERLGYVGARILREAGAKLVTGTDAPNAYLADGFSIHEELENLVAHCGFSPFEALKVVTVNAAEQQGEAGRGGIVAEGAFADLIFLDRDPLHDIRATRALSGVWARGAYLSANAIADGRKAILDAFASMPVPA